MSIFLGDTEPSKIFVGGSEVASVWAGDTKVRPTFTPKTYTIVWKEGSNPANFFQRYEDDAAGLTQGSTEFDDFFGYSAVKLSGSGVETAEVKQSSPGVLDITQLGTLTSGDNVMIKFPVRGIKMTKGYDPNWNMVTTLSITNELGKSGYQYFAFQKTGDVDSNTESTATYPLYLGAYAGYNDSNTLKSRSGKTPSTGMRLVNILTYAANNGTGYTIMGYYQRALINAYYMLKYGNPNSQSIVGAGYTTSGSATTGGTNGQTNATYGSSSSSTQVKLFGLEDWRGNIYQWMGGAFTDGSRNLYTAIHSFTASISTSQSQYKKIGTMPSTSGGVIQGAYGTNKQMFMPSGLSSSSGGSDYYTDWCYSNASRFPEVCGNNSWYTGAFYVGYNRDDWASTPGGRIMYV